MKKAKQTYQNKVHDHQKAKEATIRAEGEQQTQSSQPTQKLSSSGTGSGLGSVLYTSSANKVDKKKKQEEDSNQKVIPCSTIVSISFILLVCQIC